MIKLNISKLVGYTDAVVKGKLRALNPYVIEKYRVGVIQHSHGSVVTAQSMNLAEQRTPSPGLPAYMVSHFLQMVALNIVPTHKSDCITPWL